MAIFYIAKAGTVGVVNGEAYAGPAGAGTRYDDSVAAYNAATGNNHTFLFEGGGDHRPSGGAFLSSYFGKNFSEISTYGEGPARLDGRVHIPVNDTGWTHVGGQTLESQLVPDGVWLKTYTAGAGLSVVNMRLFADVSDLATKLGIGLRRSITLAGGERITALGSQYKWAAFQTGGTSLRLYVYTGSSTRNPPTFYQGMSIVIAAAAAMGCARGFVVRNSATTNYFHGPIILLGIGAQGMGVNDFSSGTDVLDTHWDGITVQQFMAKGAQFIGTTTTRMARRCSVKRCIMDPMFGPDEFPLEASDIWLGNQEHIEVREGSVDVVIAYNKLHNPSHAGVSVSAPSSTAANMLATNVSVVGNIITADNAAGDSRAMSVNNGYNVQFKHNHATGMTTRSQFSGQNTLVENNVWAEHRTRGLADTTGQPAESLKFAIQITNSNAVVGVPMSLTFRYNTVSIRNMPDARRGAIGCNAATAGVEVWAANALQVHSNVLLMEDSHYGFTRYGSLMTTVAQDIDNNLIVTPTATGNCTSFRDAAGQATDVNGVAVGINSMSSHSGNVNATINAAQLQGRKVTAAAYQATGRADKPTFGFGGRRRVGTTPGAL